MKKNLYLLVCALLFGAGAFAQNSNITLRSTMEFPGQTLANICGWTSPTGQEYALLGGSKGLIIVDVTNPDVPTQIVQIPGPDNLWKEIKTYGHYAYITSEGGQGVQIVDLSGLPSANLQYHHYMGDGPIAGQLNTIHALHIDVNKGFLYAFGSNLVSGGAVVLDLNADPYNPTYAGEFSSLQYIHDGFAENDTLYACHIYDGIMSIVDMSDKGAPQVLGTVETPLKFTHNAWLTSDHRAALNTDERSGSYLTSYDVTDPSDIRELDRMQTTPGSGSVVHNVHIRNDWAISSWYTDGFNIVDAHRPINLVQTGRFDTWPGSGDGFDGCWGVFPFFPSGTIVASNIEPAKLTICSPNYRRACYLEGIITDGCSGGPLAGAKITIVGGDQLIPEISTAQGIYRTGQVEPGTFKVTIEKAGYVTQTLDVQLATAQVTELNLTLEPMAFSVNGLVVDGGNGQPVPNAKIVLSSSTASYDITADANGQFNLDCVLAGTYSATVGIWGYKISQNITVNANTNATISIVKGYYDDFALDYGWKTASTASSGEWVRGVPLGTTNQGQTVNPGEDAPQDGNDRCYVTGNGGGNAGSDDVDNGTVTLTTPPMKLAEFNAVEISYRYWFFNGGGNGGTPNDNLEVILSNGTSTRTLVTHNVSASQWRLSAITTAAETPDFPFTDNMTVSFRASDNDPGHLVEAGIDIFEVTGATVGTSNIDRSIRLAASPNPARGAFAVAYDFEGRASDARLILTDITGREVLAKNLPANVGSEQIAAGLQPGIYFIRLENDGKRSLPLKVVVE